jgi:hypothetical protein
MDSSYSDDEDELGAIRHYPVPIKLFYHPEIP